MEYDDTVHIPSLLVSRSDVPLGWAGTGPQPISPISTKVVFCMHFQLIHSTCNSVSHGRISVLSFASYLSTDYMVYYTSLHGISVSPAGVPEAQFPSRMIVKLLKLQKRRRRLPESHSTLDLERIWRRPLQPETEINWSLLWLVSSDICQAGKYTNHDQTLD